MLRLCILMTLLNSFGLLPVNQNQQKSNICKNARCLPLSTFLSWKVHNQDKTFDQICDPINVPSVFIRLPYTLHKNLSLFPPWAWVRSQRIDTRRDRVGFLTQYGPCHIYNIWYYPYSCHNCSNYILLYFFFFLWMYI